MGVGCSVDILFSSQHHYLLLVGSVPITGTVHDDSFCYKT